MRNLLLPLLAISMVAVISCRKKTDVTATGSDSLTAKIDLLKDSVFLYTKEVYLWNDVIPSYEQFNPRKYSGTSELATATNVLNGIRALQPLDRFSFVTSTAEAEGIQTGEDSDLGFLIKAASIDKVNPIDSVYWFVSYVYANSPAGKAGVQRGWRLSKINGSNMDYSDAAVTTLNNIFFGSTASASFQFVKPDGLTTDATIAKSSYVANSVLYRSVISTGGKKAGYLVFNQFFGAPSRKELGDAFTYFQSQGINELIVDLRYNPGGSTETQDTLANLIAPSSANNKTMYQYVYNKVLQQNQHQLIRKKLGYGNYFAAADNIETFKKAGSINLSRVFFIVTGSTVSASELLINNLKPYMDVQLIGDTTYGKPVGFFPIPIYDYAIFPISFKTVNSAGSSDYYSGFAPNKLAGDNVTLNWGDVNDPSLAAALKFINGGSYRTGDESPLLDLQLQNNLKLKSAQQKFEANKFNGMFIENN